MKTYKLYVCMPIAKFGVDVKANYCTTVDNRLVFHSGVYGTSTCTTISSYPSQYTIIESIKDEK